MTKERTKKRKIDDGSKKKVPVIDEKKLLRCNYKVSLLPPVGHPKLLKVPLPPDHATQYMGAELEARRHWTLFSESGLAVPIDLWDPHKYKQKSETQTKQQGDIELLAMLKSRNDSSGIGDTISSTVYKEANQQGWTLNSTLMTSSSIIAKKKQRTITERGTRFEDTSILKRYDKERQQFVTVESIKQTFKDIDDIKHPRDPELSVKQALSIFPDDRLLQNGYSHISFDRPPIKEVQKLPFMQEVNATQSQAQDVIEKNIFKVSDHKNHTGEDTKWFSMYAPNPNTQKLPHEEEDYEWTSEYGHVSTQSAKFNHFFVVNDNEVVWGRVRDRSALRRKETERANTKNDTTFSQKDRETFANLPRYLKVQFVEENDEELSDDEEVEYTGQTNPLVEG